MKKRLLFVSALLIGSFAVFATTPKLGFKAKKIVVSESTNLALGSQTVTELSEKSTPAKAKAASTVPYFYSFEKTAISSIIPDGWSFIDAASKVGISSSTENGTIPTGDYWVYSNYNSAASRNAWFFSPGVTLTAGKTYYVSLSVFAPGYDGTPDEFQVTAGTAQTAVSQTTIVINKKAANSVILDEWTKITGTFTPTVDGDYNFGINHCTVAFDVNIVGFDGFAVKEASEFAYPPEAKVFNKGGLWSVTTAGQVYLSPQEKMDYLAYTKYSSAILWTFDSTADILDSVEDSLSVVYSTSGAHTTSLEAVGVDEVATVNTTITSVAPASTISAVSVSNFSPSDRYINNNYIYSSTYANYASDFEFGINSYWRKIAEKYEIPENVTITLNSISFYVGSYSMDVTNREKNVKISIYPVGTDGYPETTALVDYTTTFGTLFGTSVISSATNKKYTIAAPIAVTGSFFIVADFSANTTATSSTNKLGIFRAADRPVNSNSAYVYYNSFWESFNDVLGSNTSTYIYPNVSFVNPPTSVENPTEKGFNVYASNGILTIQKAKIGSAVLVYDVTGKLAYSNAITKEDCNFPLDFKAGIYLVKVADKITKIKF